MIISMRPHATKEEIEHVCERIREFGYKVHSIVGEERVVIGAVGVGDVTSCLESLEAAPGVESAVRISAPYKFVSREFKKERTVIPVNGVDVGGNAVRHHGRPVLGGKRKADHGNCRGRGSERRQDSAWWRLQASHLSLRLPGAGARGAETSGQGAQSYGPGHRHRGDERAGRGSGGRACEHHAGGRAQHAEFRACSRLWANVPGLSS